RIVDVSDQRFQGRRGIDTAIVIERNNGLPASEHLVNFFDCELCLGCHMRSFLDSSPAACLFTGLYGFTETCPVYTSSFVLASIFQSRSLFRDLYRYRKCMR